MSWAEDCGAGAHHAWEVCVPLTLKPLVDHVKSSFPIATHDRLNTGNPRLGYVRGDVNLFSVLDSKEGEQTQKRRWVDEGGLIDQDEIGDLSSSSLMRIKRMKGELLDGIGSHLDFSDTGIIKCIQQQCTFISIAGGVHQCPNHFTVHMCHAAKGGTCERLKRKLTLLVNASIQQDCHFNRPTEDPEVEPIRAITGKMITGLDQKFREALSYNHHADLHESPNLTTKITQYHLLRKNFIIGGLPHLISFLNIIEIIQSKRAGRQDRVVYREMWQTMEEGALSWAVEQQVCRYVGILVSLLYHPDLRVLLGIYKKLQHAPKQIIKDFYLVPFLCIYKLITTETKSVNVLINFLFKRSEHVNQRTFTQFNKVLHKIYNPRLVRPLRLVAWGAEIITVLEEWNVHAHLE
ncbi:ORF68 [Silurid herpesvirus 1]|nr:ORF68 [Silurid herpesvirus 1]